ncbi:MAG: YjbQ family protein [Candidatus Aenigmarchaeota archaeon]|nr:YjbQ family protein [Candidatus Aenigmarchaeota archaeon]
MKVHQDRIKVETKGLNDFIIITDRIEKIVGESKINKGMAFVNSLHTTTAIIIQENDPTIFKDMLDLFEKILPSNKKYEHMEEGSVNAVAHQKQNLLGNSVSIPVEEGKLVLGRWQDILFLEFFEPRQREAVVTIIGD